MAREPPSAQALPFIISLGPRTWGCPEGQEKLWAPSLLNILETLSLFTNLSNWAFFFCSLCNSKGLLIIWRKTILMYQQKTEAQLFSTPGIQSHYRLGAFATSLCKRSASVYVQEYTSPRVFTWTYDIIKMLDDFIKILRPLCGRKRESWESLCAAELAEIKAPWRLHRPALSPPLCPGGWIFKKATSTFSSTGHSAPLSILGLQMYHWISMWFIHYCKTHCCYQLSSQPSVLCFPSHTHQPFQPSNPSTTGLLHKTAYAGSSELGWSPNLTLVWGVEGRFGGFQKQLAESDHSCDLHSREKNLHGYTPFCFVVIMLAFLELRKPIM